jgi:hypothetical protein
MEVFVLCWENSLVLVQVTDAISVDVGLLGANKEGFELVYVGYCLDSLILLVNFLSLNRMLP